jgi:hypothetical protein
MPYPAGSILRAQIGEPRRPGRGVHPNVPPVAPDYGEFIFNKPPFADA